MKCRLCHRSRETGWHLKTECHKLREPREEIFQEKTWTVDELAAFINTNEVKNFLERRIS